VLADTVFRAIAGLEQSRKDGRDMTAINRPENLFEGVQPSPYEAIAPGLAAYQRDAVEAYATSRLG